MSAGSSASHRVPPWWAAIAAAALQPALLQGLLGPAVVPDGPGREAPVGAAAILDAALAHLGDAVVVAAWPPSWSLAACGEALLEPAAAAAILAALLWLPAAPGLGRFERVALRVAAAAMVASAFGATTALRGATLAAGTAALTAALVGATARLSITAAALAAAGLGAWSLVLLPAWSTTAGVALSAVQWFPASAPAHLAAARVAVPDRPRRAAHLRTALALAPTRRDVRLAAGLDAADEANWVEASRHLEAFLRARPDADDEVVILAAESAARSGQPGAARRRLEQAVASRPGHATLAQAWADFLREHGEAGAAVAALEAAVAAGGGDAATWKRLAALHAAGGRGAESADCWRKALALEPGDPEARRGLARVLADAGDLDRAADLLAALEQGDATANPGSSVELARVLARAGRLEAASAAYGRARERGARPAAGVAMEHGIALAAAGRPDEAEAAFRAVLAADPGRADASLELAWLLAARPAKDPGEAAEAVLLARAAAAAFPRDPSAAEVLAEAEAGAGDYTAAVAAGRHALELGRAWGDAAWTSRLEARVEAWQAGRQAGGETAPLHRADDSRH